MLALVMFSMLLVLVGSFVEPNALLCGSTLSSGLVGGAPSAWYALSLIVLFIALRSRLGFVLLAPTIVSAAMAPQAAVGILVASLVLFVRRFREWMVFVMIAAAIVLVILVGLPLAVLIVLSILIPIISDIPTAVWRVRAITLWFVASLAAIPALNYYVGLFEFDLIGVSLMPLPLVLFAALLIQSLIVLGNDSHASLSRSLVLLVASLLYAELAVFAMPVIIGMLAVSLERALGEERLRGSRVVLVVLVVFALVASFEEPSEPLEIDGAIVFAPEYVELACEGRAYPQQLSTWRDLSCLASIGDPDVLVPALEERGVSKVVYPLGFDEPIVYALRHSDAVFEQRDRLIVVSLP
ncbi:MAG: hypothetical protein ACMXYM_00455 [Candidatus Woesearchaeota archaeon]